jgi:hypothetical protein
VNSRRAFAFWFAVWALAQALSAQQGPLARQARFAIGDADLAVGLDSSMGLWVGASAGSRRVFTPLPREAVSAWITAADSLLARPLLMVGNGVLRHRTPPLGGLLAQVFVVRDVSPADTAHYLFFASRIDGTVTPLRMEPSELASVLGELRILLSQAGTQAGGGRPTRAMAWLFETPLAPTPPRLRRIDVLHCPDGLRSDGVSSQPAWAVFRVLADGSVDPEGVAVAGWGRKREAVAEVVRAMRFAPGQLSGRPVASLLTAAVHGCIERPTAPAQIAGLY